MNAMHFFEELKTILETQGIKTSYFKFQKNKNDYSIKFKANIVFKLNENKELLYLKNDFKDDVLSFLDNEDFTSDASFTRLPYALVEKHRKEIDNLFLVIVKKYLELSDVDTFGCCHRYLECSNEKKCIHPNMIQSLGCLYKRNLENGRIFYGINKTI